MGEESGSDAHAATLVDEMVSYARGTLTPVEKLTALPNMIRSHRPRIRPLIPSHNQPAHRLSAVKSRRTLTG